MKYLFCALFVCFSFMLPIETLAYQDEAKGNETLQWDVFVEARQEEAIFELRLYNAGEEREEIKFETEQLYELQVYTNSGESIYTCSADKQFSDKPMTKTVKPLETLTFKEVWTYPSEKELQPGTYKVKVTLLASELNGEKLEKSVWIDEEKWELPERNESFRRIRTYGEEGHYVVKGEANVNSGVFYFTVDDGHTMLVDEKVLTVQKKEGWVPFRVEITVPPSSLPDNGAVLATFYERSIDDNTIIHAYPIVLETFYE
ncbi:BsuPI-related putative proteinase inhibitor [Bacillus fonticola]|uniref:BsuPI-related putative proteinase inhibitor n=1 Tax=Bacillus fonticola TaxID=2728853 RepID=UPI00147414AF|nr:BsuPI-related putative proteinase inhibitor [Bacillus fonticola]